MIRRLLVAVMPLAFATAAAQQPGTRLVLRDVGPGRMAETVGAALTRPYVLLRPESERRVFPRDTTIRTGLVVVGADVYLAAAVQGNVVVIGGDLFLRPGARIDGAAIAVGGAVYPTFLGYVRGEVHSFRDETLDPTTLADGSIALDYRALRTRAARTFALGGVYGARIPSYDRVNGVTLPWAPTVSLDTGRITLEPTLTYRTHLGKIDPSVLGELAFGRRGRLEASVGRTTRTNDDWIQSDLGNSMGAVFSGRDTRNWYRADRIDALAHLAFERRDGTLTPFAGGVWERAWTTGIQSRPPRHLAWSVSDRSDSLEGMSRGNPVVSHGTIASLVGGAAGEWEVPTRTLTMRAIARVEAAPVSPGDARFTQLTADGRIEFPLMDSVMFRFDLHTILTAGDAPPQRYGYLGGSSTLPTVLLLSRGGDWLLHTESRASMKLRRVRLPVVGSPTLMVRHLMGAAGIGALPGVTHNLAARVSLMVLRAEFVIDPVTGNTDTSVGVSFSR